jgi:uroporphyrinogen-III decarboxylase
MSSRQLVEQAIRMERPPRVPVMCQMANGHTILNTGVHPIDYFTDNEVWADCLLKVRALYDFDGVLCHKPGRVHGLMDLVERADYDAETPTLHFADGARIECTRDDDAYYKPAPGFRRPTIRELDPGDLLGWAPESFRAFQASKATLPITDPGGFEDHVFGMLDLVLQKASGEYAVHGEVRSPFDHFLNILGMEDGLIALLDDPEKCRQVLAETTKWSVALAVAQVRRGAQAIKISSPFAGNAFLSREMYLDFIQPYEGELARAVRAEGAAIYTHTCGAIGDRLDLLCGAGVNGIECLDPPPLGDVDIDEAVALLKDKIFIKGNVDPVNTLLRGDAEKVRADVTRVLEAARGMRGFILSSACSIAPPTPPANIQRMVEVCREFRP